MFEDTPRTPRRANTTLWLAPKGVVPVEQTNGSEIERSARNWRYTFSLQNPFLITRAQIKIVFLFQVGVIEKEIAEPDGRTPAASNKTLI